MSAVQRFCPVCDRLFLDSEAVLACADCEILHHPACWIRNGGCSASPDHNQSPVPKAYGLVPPRHDPPHMAEGTRSVTRGTTRERTSAQRAGVPAGTVIGADTEPPPVPQRNTMPPRLASPPPEPPGTTIRHGRYVPPEDELSPVRSGMPKIYRRTSLLRFWFVPVGFAAAAGAAILTAWAVTTFAGGDDDEAAGDDDDFVATATAEPETATAAVTTSPTVDATEPPGTPGADATATFAPTSGQFLIGETLVVTGAGDCLNVRVGPARSNDAIVCLEDGETVRVVEGPTDSDTFRWWKVATEFGEGWAVEDYFVRP